VDLPRGTAIQVRLTERISSEKAKTGDKFEAVLDQDLIEDGNAVARRGDLVRGKLLRVNNGDRDEGDMIEMTLTELRSGNRNYDLDTNNIIVRTKDEEKGDHRDETIVGGGAGVGAVIGAIAGGLKGAIIGAAVGAGAGVATILITDNDKVEFDPEQKFRFYLEKDVEMATVGIGSTTDQSARSDDRYEQSDDRYGRSDNGSATAGYSRENIRDLASELDRHSQHVWSMIQDDSRIAESSRSSDQESEDATRLYMAISNFANSTKQFQQFARNNASNRIRGAAQNLVRQAEDIDQLLQSVNTFGHLQDDWREVQSSLSRVASNFNLAYTPGGSSTYRAE